MSVFGSRGQAAGRRPSSRQSAEQRPSSRQSAEQRPSSRQSAEQRPSSRQSAEQRPSNRQSAEQRPSSRQVAGRPLSFFDTHFARIYLYEQPHLRFDITPLNQKILPDTHANPSPQTIILINFLKEYFERPHAFSSHIALPYLTHVSPFQKKVYEALCDIPFGKTMTYLELARTLKTAPRAIGQACKRNPLPFLIPCHRVLAKTHLGGYAGKQDGFFRQVKIELLKHEGIFIDESTHDPGFSKKR